LIDYDIPLELIDSRVISTMQAVRYVFGRPIYPSPLRRGWARLDGSKTSRHYAINRLSDAGDVFPDRGYLMHCWLVFQQMKQVGGLGFYLDTRGPDGDFWPMLHFDLRPGRRIFWARQNGTYMSLGANASEFWQAAGRAIDLDMQKRSINEN
jgi:hypothetical protein